MAKNLARSIYSSQSEPIEGIIKGTIPKWLNGTLFRNGPGRFRFGNKTYKHLFDGMACVNKFQIKEGKVYFTNKLLETKTHKQNLENNILYPMFGTKDPCSKLFDRFRVLFNVEKRDAYDNTNVNIVPFGNNQLYALTETNMVVRVDPQNLNIINHGNVMSYIKPTMSSIAHPHVEEDGSWISVGMQARGKNLSYDFMKFQVDKNKNVENACENLKLIGRIPSSHKSGLSYFHSFGLTKNYIVFLEQSVIIDLKSLLLSPITNKPFSSALKTNENFKTQIHLINRKTGELFPQKFYTDAQFTFHHINAFETNETDPTKNELHVDVCSYDAKIFDINGFQYDENVESQVDQIFEKLKSFPRRIRIPLHDKKSNNEKIYCEIKDIVSDAYMELPTINYNKYNTKPYSYAYGIGSTKSPYSIIKINTNKYNDYKKAIIKTNNRVIAPSEPVFVESPDAKSEDDGVLLTLVLGDTYDSLIILDAKTLDEIGRAELPENVKATFTFHGFFADEFNYSKLNN